MTRRQSDRAQIGIGTLVVFLSMVLVASIAGGVLINTTGILGGSAAAESQATSVEGLLVIGQTGEHIREGRVGVVNLTVTVGPEASAVDLRDTTVTWVGPDGAYNVVNDDAPGSSEAPTYAVTAVSDPDGSAPVLNGAHDRLILTFDLGSNDRRGVSPFGSELEAGDMVKVTLVTGDGVTTTTRLAVPPTVRGRPAVVL